MRREVVVDAERLARQKLEHTGLEPREPVAEPDDQAPAAGDLGGIRDQLAQRVRARPAQFVALSRRRVVAERGEERPDHVAHVDRREPRPRAREGEYERREREQAREAIEETVLGPEDDARAEARDRDAVVPGRVRRPLAVKLRAQILAGRVRAHPERAHVQHPPDAVVSAGRGELAGQFRVYAAEPAAAVLVQDADEVDGGVAAREVQAQVRYEMDVGLDDLARRHHQHVPRAAAPPGEDARRVPCPGERGHEMAADETRTAENRDPLLPHDPGTPAWERVVSRSPGGVVKAAGGSAGPRMSPRAGSSRVDSGPTPSRRAGGPDP